jgi:alanyl-tRNA synthetase
MRTEDIRKKYQTYFKEKGHEIIPSASLVPENDPTTLFTGSGMQPLIPYLLGEKHPLGDRLVNSQKSFRSGDIEDVGDNRHTTFFEMLGNWSLGDYFKKEQLPWIFDFLTQEIGLDPKKIYVTAFSGDRENNIPKDTETAEIWKKLFAKHEIDAGEVDMGTEENAASVGMQDGRIFYYGDKNWWSRSGVPGNMPIGEPGGPDSEIFYEFSDIEHNPTFGKLCHPNCDCGRYLEIGNSVFMEYIKTPQGSFDFLPKKNVDFGGGLERIAAAKANTPDIFKIDVFSHLLNELETLSGKKYDDPTHTISFRVIADHLRSAVFLIGDGVSPSNTDQGYFVRRLLRRSVRYWDTLGITNKNLASLVPAILEPYKTAYPRTYSKIEIITREISEEEERFRKTLEKGMRVFLAKQPAQDLSTNTKIPLEISGEDLFNLWTVHGFPVELSLEVAKEKNIPVREDAMRGLEILKNKHRETSRLGAEQKFKGGLADTSEISLKYHTATHLLHQALRDVLGPEVAQKGSNITHERLRFDFSFPRKLTDEEKASVEDLVNQKIQESLPVQQQVLNKEEAIKTGALHFFDQKYPDEVSVYFIGDTLASAYSKEFCGGPHVENIGVLGTFKISKEEAVSAGVRRIKAVLE